MDLTKIIIRLRIAKKLISRASWEAKQTHWDYLGETIGWLFDSDMKRIRFQSWFHFPKMHKRGGQSGQQLVRAMDPSEQTVFRPFRELSWRGLWGEANLVKTIRVQSAQYWLEGHSLVWAVRIQSSRLCSHNQALLCFWKFPNLRVSRPVHSKPCSFQPGITNSVSVGILAKIASDYWRSAASSTMRRTQTARRTPRRANVRRFWAKRSCSQTHPVCPCTNWAVSCFVLLKSCSMFLCPEGAPKAGIRL